MGFYSERIFPYLMDWSMSSPKLIEYRQTTMANVKGDVLEIGFGTGLNLSYYPEAIHKIVTVDANPAVDRLARKRIQMSPITVDNRILNGEHLPMTDGTFDSVVSTFTLCSITNIEQAISEIHRVLKPGGKFFFVEHGLSNEPRIQVWQNRLTPIQKVIGDGCHLNRNIRQLIEHEFDTLTIQEMYAENLPKVMAYFYQGVAIKAT